MRSTEVLGLSLLLFALPLSALANNVELYAATSLIGFAIVLYLMAKIRPWTEVRSSVSFLFFSGIYTAGVAIGIFLILPLDPKKIALLGAVESLPFILLFILTLPKVHLSIKSDILKTGNGLFAMLLVVIVGAVIGRFFHNFYQQIIIYTGFLVAGFLTYLYERS